MPFRRLVDFAKRGAPAAAQEVDSRVGRDTRKPVSCLLLVLELVLPLQGLNKGFLRQVLGIRHIPDDAVNLNENAPQVFRNEAVLAFKKLQTGLDDFAHLAVNSGFHGVLTMMTQGPAKR